MAESQAARELQLAQELDRATAAAFDLTAAIDSLRSEHEAEAHGLRREIASVVAESSGLRTAIDTQAREHETRERELRENMHRVSVVSEAATADAAGERQRAIELSSLLARQESREAEAQERLANEVAESERIRAQNTELAHALTAAIVNRRPAARPWWRLFART